MSIVCNDKSSTCLPPSTGWGCGQMLVCEPHQPTLIIRISISTSTGSVLHGSPPLADTPVNNVPAVKRACMLACVASLQSYPLAMVIGLEYHSAC